MNPNEFPKARTEAQQTKEASYWLPHLQRAVNAIQTFVSSQPKLGERTHFEQVGWGLLYNQREDPAVLEALEPLIRHRERRCGRSIPHFRLSDRELLQPHRHMIRQAQVQDYGHELPYFLLIIGGPCMVPFECQHQLDLDHALGRLGFDHAEDYARYADRLVAFENSAERPQAQMRLLGPINDPMTERSAHHLVAVLHEQLQVLAPNWRFESQIGAKATCEAFAESLSAAKSADILLVASHAVVTSHPTARETVQGSFIGSEWQGPGHRLERSNFFCASDLRSDTDLRGAILFHFGCFTAGTPAYSPFETDFRADARPFLAHFPKCLLQMATGPLAFIGHIESSFSASFFCERGQTPNLAHFTQSIHNIILGQPLGHALLPIRRRFAEKATALMKILSTGMPWVDAFEPFWAELLDSRGYLILGDPAARLQVDQALRVNP